MMKRRKRNCLLRGIWLVAAVCVAAGCAASPAGHNSADVESETYEESAAVKLSETNGEAAEPLAAGLQKPETWLPRQKKKSPRWAYERICWHTGWC